MAKQQRKRGILCCAGRPGIELQRLRPGIGRGRATSAQVAGQRAMQVAGTDSDLQAGQGVGKLLVADTRVGHGDRELRTIVNSSLHPSPMFTRKPASAAPAPGKPVRTALVASLDPIAYTGDWA